MMALITITACTDQGYPDDEHFLPWRIGAAISYEFPAMIFEAYGTNEKEDWTSVMLPFTGNLARPSRLNLDNIRHYTYPEYDGYVLPLSGAINFTPNQLGLGTKSLPDNLYIYWQVRNSLVEYVTVVSITTQIKSAMTKKYIYQKGMFKGQSCYQTDFIFGLLPDGRAKLWLKGCDYYTYIGEYQPTKSIPPENPKLAKNKPIPWDKVNQIWVNEYYQLQNLEDVVPHENK
ncbi:hypothetical protein C1M56_01815 [Vibrio diazotrophicus]|jgi:hypothetical protein|nr:hypothetical protein C1M56_01815 [Vibrio diazotrophicus]